MFQSESQMFWSGNAKRISNKHSMIYSQQRNIDKFNYDINDTPKNKKQAW